MRNVIWVAAFAAAICVACVAGETEPAVVGGKALTQERLRAVMRRVSERRTGGTVRKEGSARGAIAVVNAQRRVDSSRLSEAMQTIDRWIRVKTIWADVPGAIDVKSTKSVIVKVGGAAGVCLVDSPDLPSLLAAPEDGWAMVNVSRLSTGDESPEVLASRVRKEILRAVSFVLGGAYSARADPLMRDIRQPSDLDRCPVEAYGIETIATLRESSKLYGVTPWIQSTYLQACQEGWAPAPTNELQRAVWDRVHSEKERGPGRALKIAP